MSKSAIKLNQFATIKGAAGTFATDKEKTYVVALNANDLGVIPVIFSEDDGEYNAIVPTRLSKGDASEVCEWLQMIMKNTSYPTINYVRGRVNYERKDVDFIADYPLGEFIPRVMKPGLTDCSEKIYRKMLAPFYGLPEESLGTTAARDFTKSLSYKPFADLVSTYGTMKEKDYNLTPSEEALRHGIMNGTVKFVGLQGAPGTGKSTCLKVIACKEGIPFYEFSGEFADGDQLMGSYGVKEDSESGEVKPCYIPGPVIECAKYGGMVSINEINMTNPQLLSQLMGYLDGTQSIVDKNTKEVIHIHPNFVFGCTWNPKEAGTMPLNRALFNRMNMVICYSELTVAELMSRMLTNFPEADKTFVQKLCELPPVVQTWASQVGSTGYCTLRQLMSFYNSIMSKNMSLEEFSDEFSMRIVNPVCSCNCTALEKVKNLLDSEDCKKLVTDLYSMYGGAVLAPVDYSFVCSGGGAYSVASETDDDDADVLKDFMNSLND